MDLEQLQDLQQELLGIIFLIVAPYNAEEEIDMKDRALKIIDELKDHINDDIEMNNLRVTILDCIVLCDSQGNVRLNNRSLLDLEDAVKSIGGKTSQEERENRKLKKEIRGKLCLVAFAIFGQIVSRNLRESEVGTIFDAAFIGSLSIQCYMFLASLISREAEQRVVDSTSESTAGLSAALAVGTPMLINKIVRSIVGTNMEFGESLRSVLMTTTAAGAGAALSTAWIKRTFSTNLENVATEQQNIQGQNI